MTEVPGISWELSAIGDDLGGVGDVLAGAAEEIVPPTVDALADAAEEIVPPSVWGAAKAFFETGIGKFAWRALLVAAILLAGMVLVRVINKTFTHAVDRLRTAKNPNASVLSFARYAVLAVAYCVIFAGVVAVVPVLNSILTTLLTAGGVLAIVVSVAAQETLGSIASGMIILFFKPFVIGDVLHVVSLDVTGTVEDITLQHTILKTVENKRIIIPNSKINGEVIENFDYGEKRVCLMLDLSITYESNLEKALAILEEEVGAHPDYLDPRTPAEISRDVPRVTVRVQELAASAVVIRALLWGEDNGTAFRMKCDLLRRMKARFDEEGIAFAYPHIELVQKKTDRMP